MRIVLISQALNAAYGGSAVSEATLSAWLKRSHEVLFLCRRGCADATFLVAHDAATVQTYSPWQVAGALLLPISEIAKRIASADVVHINGHWRWENFFFASLCRLYRVPYVLHPRGMLWLGHRRVRLKKWFNRILGRWVVKWASKIIALSRFETQQFAPYQISSDRVQIIPNGIVPEPERKSKKTPPSEVPESAFLYLGRLESRKNLLFLLRAYAKFREQGGGNPLVLVGPGEKGYADELEREIARLCLQASVSLRPGVFPGDKRELYRRSLATIYPAYGEPFGRVPFEAIAAGGLAVVPEESGAAEYIRDFFPDLIFNLREPESLLAVMHRLSEGGADFALEQKRMARQWIQEELHWRSISDRTERVYRGLIQR